MGRRAIRSMLAAVVVVNAVLAAATAVPGPDAPAVRGVVGADVDVDAGSVPLTHGGTFGVSFQLGIDGGVDAAGVGLRNQGNGIISLSGVPPGANVLLAYLYWQIMDVAPSPAFGVAMFNGVPVPGTFLGSDVDLCWGTNSTFAYRADVTPLVTGSGLYPVSIASGSALGLDPWSFGSPLPMAEGASLVVVYTGPRGAPFREVTIVDGIESLVGTSVKVPIPRMFPGMAPARLITVGADGQITGAVGDAMEWNGFPLAVDSWDGSDPQLAPPFSFGNLWDTDFFPVVADPIMNTVTVHSLGDCVGPQAFVLEVDI